MCSYLDRYFVVFGGAGQFIRKIQKRETFNDLHFFDVNTKQWIDMREDNDEKH